MKVKILVSVAGLEFSYGPGDVVDIPKDRAEEFIRIGYATPIEIKRKPATKRKGK